MCSEPFPRRLLLAGVFLLSVACGAPRSSQEAPVAAPVPSKASTVPPRVTESSKPVPSAPEPAASGTAAAVDASVWGSRLKAFYAALSGDERQVRAAYLALFAPKLTRFIGLRDVSRERAIDAAWQFLGARTSRSYTLQGQPRIARDAGRVTLRAYVSMSFQVPMPAAFCTAVPTLADETILTTKVLEVEMDIDSSEHVVAYTEKSAFNRPVHVRVATRGYAMPFAEGCFPAPAEPIDSVPLAVGAVLEPTGESVGVYACGPPTQVARYLVKGQSYWVLTALYELVPNPNGGNSLGGTTFVE